MIIALLVLIVTGSQAKAQMGAAQTMVYDSDTIISFNAPLDKVWNLIKDPSKWNELSNGKITSITTKGNLSTTLHRKMTFADGSTRTDEVSQFMVEQHFIVNKVLGPLPNGITDNMYLFSVKHDPGKGSQMFYGIKVEGDAEGRKALLATLKKEMDDFIAGIQKALEKNPD